MIQYLKVVENVLNNGVDKEDRTGTGIRSIAGCFFEHDMSDGFPLVTTKKVPFGLVATELEFFIRGLTDKQWLIDRKCHIWDEWCSPDIVPYGHDKETQDKMMDECELGPIYGWQWRNFGGEYIDCETPTAKQGVDQLVNLINTLRNDPTDRRMIVTAWNPVDLHRMALPPCHWAFQVTVAGGKLNLMWNQRSVDVALGLPFNIASYALLLHLLAKETGYGEGRLCGFFGDTHIYSNHIEQIQEVQLSREPFPLCDLDTYFWDGVFEWKAKDSVITNYQHHERLSYKIAV